MSSKSGIVGTWVGIFALVAIVLGELEHASRRTRASSMAHVSVRGNVIIPHSAASDGPQRAGAKAPWPV